MKNMQETPTNPTEDSAADATPEAAALDATAAAATPAEASESMAQPDAAAPAATEPASVKPVSTEPAAAKSPTEPTANPAPADAAGAATDSSAAGTENAAPASAALPDLAPAACAALLAQHFPALFAAGRAMPIKLRVQADIQQRVPGVFSRKSLSIFLHRHTTSTPYIKALLQSPHRFDLDGQPAGEIAEEHRAAATAELGRRQAIVQARRAAEREAQREAYRQAQRAARRQGPAAAEAAQASGAAPGAVPTATATATATAGEGPTPGDIASGANPDEPTQTPATDRRAPRHDRPRRPEQGGRPGPGAQALRRNEGPRFGPRPDARSGPRPGSRPDPHKPGEPRSDGPRTPRPAGHLPHQAPQRPAFADVREPAEPAPPAIPLTPEQAAENEARRSRAAVLRAFETTTLTRANFCALKGLSDAALEAILVQARTERDPRPGRASPVKPR